MYKSLTTIVLIFPVFSHGVPAISKPSCPSYESPTRAVAADGNQIVLAMGPRAEDPRKKLSDISKDEELKELWPKASAKELNSVQIFVCGDRSGSATLACDAKTIIVTAHQLRNPYNGGKLRWEGDKDKECYLSILDSKGEPHEFPIEIPKGKKLKENIGTEYPTTEGQKGNDWAVLTLRQKVPLKLAKPAPVVTAKNISEITGKQFVQVSAYHEDFGDSNNPPPAYSVATSVASEKDNGQGSDYLVTNGKVGHGASGGGNFTLMNSEPQFAGVTVEKIDHGDNANLKSDGSYVIPVSGKFLEALKNTTSNKDCIKSYRSESQQAAL